jgi:O-antigen/teichoic acid export membrane protein
VAKPIVIKRTPSHVALLKLLRRFAFAVLRGPMSRNLGAAVGVQACLLISGTLSARLLGPEKRGYLAILLAWPSAIGQLGAVGMSLAATYFLSARLISGTELVAVLRRPAAAQLIVLTMLNAAVILGYTFISGAPILLAACISLAQLPATICLDYGLAFVVGTRRHGTASIMRVVSPATYSIGLIALYVSHSHSLAPVAVVASAAAVISGLFALITGLRALRTVHAPNSVVAEFGFAQARRKVLAFGRKGYVGYLSPVDSFRIDQLLVGVLVSPRALGIYVVGAAFTNFGRMVAVYVGLSATPEIAAKATDAERRHAVRRTLLLAGAILTIVTFAFAMFVIVAIPFLFGATYKSAIPVAEILLVAGWLLSMKRIAVDTLRGAGEMRVGTQAEILNLVLFLLSCVPLGLLLGGPGVALALVFASAGGSLLLVRRLRQLGIVGGGPSSLDSGLPAMGDQ